jgi:hypothetical protein
MGLTEVAPRCVCYPKVQERMGLDQDQLYNIMLEFPHDMAHKTRKERMFEAGPRHTVEALPRDDAYA